MWNGVRDFAKDFDAKFIDSVEDLPNSPGKDVLVSIPYKPFSNDDLASIKQFVENGGTLLLMDDFGYGNSFLEYIGIEARFDNILLLDPLFNYKNEYFPRIMDFTSAIKDVGIKVIGFNHATALSNISPSNALAWSSNMSFLDTNKNGTLDSGELKGPFVVAATYPIGTGTIELVSDTSLTINVMIGSNNNAAFVKYLVNLNGIPDSVFLDRSHLTKSPLDISKINLTAARGIISNPYALIGLIAVIFAIIAWYTFKRGLISG